MQSNYFKLYNLPQSLKPKAILLQDVLNQPIVNIHNLKKLSKQGIPDQAFQIRQYCWKLLFGYLPADKSKWNTIIKANQMTYQQYIKVFLPEQRYKQYPLILDKHHQRWKQLNQDFLLWQQIQKDASRTHAQLNFFNKPTKSIMIPFLTGARKQRQRLLVGKQLWRYQQFIKNKQLQRVTYKYHIMARILFVYSKLNPKIKYVQGMNQVLAPIYYLINSNKAQQNIQEASCFYMFNNAMSTVLEMHIKDLDDSQNGVSGKLNSINKLILALQPTVWMRFQQLKIDSFFYSFRWIALLYAQQFQLFDVIRLWQSIFSCQDRVKFMNYIAISIIISKKQLILKQQFTNILQCLQNLKYSIDIVQLIYLANQLMNQCQKIDIQAKAQKNARLIETKNKKKQKIKN